MHLPPFRLERFFARWEFEARHLLCASDVEALGMGELLALADLETIGLWDSLRLGYTEAPGHPLLRAEIAALYDGLDADGVLACAGAEEAIFLTALALLGPGDHAVVPVPAYASLWQVARSLGADVTLLPLDPAARWLPGPDALRAALRPETRLVVLNFPHNPTGALPDLASFQALVDVVRDSGAWLFADEVYRFLEHDPADRLPPAVELYERAIGLGVMSKAFGLAGLRIGWIACRDPDLLRRVAHAKDYTTICNSAPSEILAIAALRARGRVLERCRGIVLRNLPVLRGFLERNEGRVECVAPRAGCIAFPRLVGLGPVDELAAELVERTGVLILPGGAFHHEGDHFRLGFGRTDFPEALAAFEGFLDERRG